MNDDALKNLNSDKFIFDKLMISIDIIKNNIDKMQKNVQELKKYLYGVNRYFNQEWITKLKGKEFGQTDYFKEVSTRYHSLYEEAVNKIRNLVDLNNGLKMNDSNKNKVKDKEQTDKYNEIALKWTDLSGAKERFL